METYPAPEHFRLGTCAWSFEDWHGVFYPAHLPASERLAWYSRFLPSVEIDSTFYAPPPLQTARHWLEVTPPHFRFSCKMPREITHQRRLRGSREVLREFLASVAPLQAKLSAILIQLPPYCTPKKDERALVEFLELLPREFRFAVEFRDPAWDLPRVVHLLQEHQVCWAWNDLTPPEREREGAFEFLPHTADFLYVRLLGDPGTKYLPGGSRRHRYDRLQWPRESSLDNWAVRIHQQAESCREVLVYVNNHFEGLSPATCKRFAERFGKEIQLPRLEEVAPPKRPEDDQLELSL